jgi:hypothetical protein
MQVIDKKRPKGNKSQEKREDQGGEGSVERGMVPQTPRDYEVYNLRLKWASYFEPQNKKGLEIFRWTKAQRENLMRSITQY